MMMSDAGMFTFAVILIISLAVIILTIPLYIIESLALYSLAKKRGIGNASLAWIPFARQYILGNIADDIVRAKIFKFRWVLPFLGTFYFVMPSVVIIIIRDFQLLVANHSFLSFFIAFMPTIFGSIFFNILPTIAIYRIFKEYRPNSAVLFTVLCAMFFPIFRPIFLFIIRSDMPYTEKSSAQDYTLSENPFTLPPLPQDETEK